MPVTHNTQSPNRPRYKTENEVWDVNLLTWVAMLQPILNAGTVVVSGTVNQGTGGNSPWSVQDALYSIEMDYVGGTNPVYFGRAASGSATSSAVWQIKKLTYDVNNNPTTVLWAGGSTSFTNVWDNRAGLSYS